MLESGLFQMNWKIEWKYGGKGEEENENEKKKAKWKTRENLKAMHTKSKTPPSKKIIIFGAGKASIIIPQSKGNLLTFSRINFILFEEKKNGFPREN